MKAYRNNVDTNEYLVEKIRDIRSSALKKKRKYPKDQLKKPISFWIKKNRLLNEIGKEFTIILRTRGCSWALGESGGCSMCGYVQDANIDNVELDQIKNQFDFAFQNKIEEIEKDNDKYVMKIFNSGSFFDDGEIGENVRTHIYNKISEVNNIKEVVVESRVEYIESNKLNQMREYLENKYIEVGIGLESVSDYIRNNYVNKGLLLEKFENAVQLLKKHDIGVKTYLLFKPPFLSEIGAIDDCVNSIRTLIDLRVNTISINPLNIQKGSLVEYLWYQNRYRPPWFYSLIESLNKSLTQKDLENVRLLADPSGAGTKRGIHNCLKRECNEKMIKALKSFVLNQDLKQLKQIDTERECVCKIKYYLQRNYS